MSEQTAPSSRVTILAYSAAIIVALHFINPSAGLFVVPLSFLLKNKLHLSATGQATFTLWVGIPGYLSFLFGLARDFWNPFGLGDRGYFLLFGTLSALVFAVFAFVPMSEGSIFTVAILTTVAFLFMWSAWNGLGSTLGQRYAMSGQISALWNFSPGTLTVLQYYLSNTMHASDTQWGEYNAISFLASIPAYILFGFLSPRVSLRVLLWGGAILGTTQMLPLLFVHSATGALIAAVPIGLTGGIATAAYMDLLIRSCPKGLEGTMMMACWSMYTVAVNFGNLWGTDLYDHHGGFVACVIATTIVYALILPVIALVPKRLIATADGSSPA